MCMFMLFLTHGGAGVGGACSGKNNREGRRERWLSFGNITASHSIDPPPIFLFPFFPLQ